MKLGCDQSSRLSVLVFAANAAANAEADRYGGCAGTTRYWTLSEAHILVNDICEKYGMPMHTVWSHVFEDGPLPDIEPVA